MDDIRREDRRILIAELLNPSRLMAGAVISFFLGLALVQGSWGMAGVIIPLVWVSIGITAYNRSIQRRFRNANMRSLWQGCRSRLDRFEEVLVKMRKEQVADLQEMPKTIRNVGDTVYAALRRADLIADEIEASEHGMIERPPSWHAGTNDPQSRELYRIADKNIAEYRNQFAGIIAGVKRAEAQAAVFMTTVDSLRMKMIGYRLVGRGPELASHEFLEALAEARAQLQSIDTALEELDLAHFPKQISVVTPSSPPPIPAEARIHVRPEDE